MTCTVSGLGMSIKSTFQRGQGKKSKALPPQYTWNQDGHLWWKALDLDDLTEIFGSTYTIIIIIVAYTVYTNCISHKTQRHKKFPELHGHYIITCGQCFQKTECLLLAFPFPKELFSIMRFCLNQDRVFMDLMTKILLCMTFLITSMTLWNADSSSKLNT